MFNRVKILLFSTLTFVIGAFVTGPKTEGPVPIGGIPPPPSIGGTASTGDTGAIGG